MFSGGLKGWSQYVDLVSLSLNTYVYRQAHPALRRLNLNLALFIIQQLGDYLNPAVSVFCWILVDSAKIVVCALSYEIEQLSEWNGVRSRRCQICKLF